MKKVFAAIGQLILFVMFLALFFSGEFFEIAYLYVFHSFFHSPHWFVTPTSYFNPDGLLLMTGLYVIVLAIEALCKRIRTAGLWTSVAFVAALVIGIVEHYGVSHPSL
jgi:hypothetical protein